MPRKPRPTHAGLYHVASGATRPDPFFRDDVDRGIFVVELATMLAREDVVCVAFCVLTTHYHLILNAADSALPRAMHRLNWHYARAANRRHQRVGHAVGGRYMAVPLEDDGHFLTCVRYVAWNPVTAGICKRPQDSRWSSYATTVGVRRDYSFVDAARILGCLARTRATAIQRLRGFVEAPTASSALAAWQAPAARRAA